MEINLNSPFGQVFRVDIFVQGGHITAMYIESLPHSGIEKGLKNLKGCIKKPILIDNMQGGCPNGHGSLRREKLKF